MIDYAARKTDKRGLTVIIREAMAECGSAADEALAMFHSWHSDGQQPRRIPGVDTKMRLAVSIWCGRTVEEAAAREYVYRWNLASDRWLAFPPPHAFGQ